EGGLPALLTFLLFLGSWFLRGIRSVATEQAGERRGMLVTTLAVCLVLAAVNAFSGTEAQIWIFWGLLIALCQTPTKHNSLGGLTSARNDNSPARAIRGYSPSLTGPV